MTQTTTETYKDCKIIRHVLEQAEECIGSRLSDMGTEALAAFERLEGKLKRAGYEL